LKDNPAEYGDRGKLHFEKTATPAQLKKIREDLQRENRKVMIRSVAIIVIVIAVMIYFIGFAKF
jgi:fatty acid desaturase